MHRKFATSRSKILIGVALTLLATAAWLANLDTATNSREYFVAARDLATSSAIADSTVQSLEANLGSSGESYLLADYSQLDRWFLTEPVAAGELIPLSSLAAKSEENCLPIILGVGTTLPRTLSPGSVVDLWAAQQSSVEDSIPYELALGAELISVREVDSGIGDKQQKIEVCVSAAEIRSVVEAIATQATVVAVRSKS